MGFKVADAYVQVTADDTGLAADLRSKIEAATEEAAKGVEAKTGLGLTDEAPAELKGDVEAAVLTTAEGVKAEVGVGLKDDAVEELDAEVKAGIEVVEEDAQIKVAVDPKQAKKAGEDGGNIMVAAIGAAAILGAPAAIGAVFAGLPVALSAASTEIQALTGTSLDLGSAMQIANIQTQNLKENAADAAANIIPGLTVAMQRDTPIVTAMGGAIEAVGGSIGQAFSNMTVNAGQTAQGISASGKIIGTTFSTVGTLVGNLAATAGPALSSVSGSVDGVLSAVGRMSSIPGVMGAATGAFAAWQADGPISKGLGAASNGLLKVAENTEGASGLLDKVSGASLGAATGLDTMAGVMGGPWGIAIGAGIGLVTGLVESFTQGVAQASDFTTAIAQDGDAIGSNTESVIANTIAKTNMAQIAQTAGISEQQLIEYASGDKQAQDAVTGALNAKSAALQKSNDTGTVTVAKSGELTSSANSQGVALDKLRLQINEVTGAVAAGLQDQQKQTSALLAAEGATNVFTAAVNLQQTALRQASENLLINDTALNDSLAPQAQLSDAAIKAEVAYQGASQATSAYTNSLNALYGQYGDTSEAQAALTTSLTGLKGNITSGTNAVDLSTAAGAKNYAQFNQTAQAAETYATKLYQQTQDAGQANAALQAGVTQLDSMAAQAGLTTKQIATLNTELFGVPTVKQITINADTYPASAAVNALIRTIDSSSAVVQVNAATGQITHYAEGGDPVAGETALVGEKGPEIVTFGAAAHVTPNNQIRTVGGGGSSGGSSGGGGGVSINTLNVHMNALADFTNPHSLNTTSRLYAIQISNAINQVTKSRVGARG